MKKLLALVLALCMVAALCACGTTAATTTATEAAPAAAEEAVEEAAVEEAAPAAEAVTYKVGISIYQFTDNFMTLYRNKMEELFKAASTDEVKYEVTIVDGKNDMAEQTNQVNTFIAQGMDVIILNLVQTSSAEAVVKTVVDAGIPLVLINREPAAENMTENAEVCYVGAKAQDSGTYQGQMIAALDNKGDLNGDGKVSYIMIEGDPENSDAQYRTEFSVAALSEVIEVECLDDQIGMWDQTKGNELCANALAKYGDAIEVVFCNNDAMALGAAAAIKDAGRVVGEDIYLVGVDALDEAVEMVKDGSMTGTVLNDANGQAQQAVDCAIALLNGEAVEDYYWVPYVMVNQEYALANY